MFRHNVKSWKPGGYVMLVWAILLLLFLGLILCAARFCYRVAFYRLNEKAQDIYAIPPGKQYEVVADRILAENGFKETATVTVQKETFTTRKYDTFVMPAGVYDALRITVGEGQGQNWWCVVFPQLCLPAVSEGMEAEAAGAGFSDTLTGALEGEYEVRFFLLDWLGWLENFLFGK
jgi:hypothetical protein